MKKILLSLVVVGIIVLVVYLVLGSRSNNEQQTPIRYIDYSPLQPETESGNPIRQDITTILKPNMSSALNSIVNSIYRDYYYVFSCSEEIGGGQALILTAKYDGSMARGGYDGSYQKIKDWEKNAVADIGHIIFPFLEQQTAGVNFVWFEPYVVDNPHIIVSRDFHKALFYVGDTSYEMHYGWTLNYVVFAPSQVCLENMMMALYHAH